MKRSVVLWFCAMCGAAVGAPAVRAEDPPQMGRAVLRPSIARVAPRASVSFKVVMEPQRLRTARVAEGVSWSVNGVPGGNSEFGTIDARGTYRAPAKPPSPPEVHIQAEVPGAENQYVWGTVLIGSRAPVYQLEKSWGEDAQEGEHLGGPTGIALDFNHTLVIADSKRSRVYRFVRDGRFLDAIGRGPDNARISFAEPRDVAVDRHGRVFVSDDSTGPPRIRVFSPEGDYLFGFAQKGAGPGRIFRTGGMAFSPDGRFFVVDIDNMRVSIFSESGEFLAMWDQEGRRVGGLNAPYGLAIDPNGDVFIAGYYGPCQKFSKEGDFLLAFAHPDPPDGPVGFQSATGDRWGNVYLATRSEGESPEDFDPKRGKTITVMKFNNAGDYITEFRLPSGELGETRMAVDEEDRLYIVFNRKDRVGVEVYRED